MKTIKCLPEAQKYNSPSKKAAIAGTVAGLLTRNVSANFSLYVVSPILAKKMESFANSCNNDEFLKAEKALARTIKESGLEAKGVNIIEVTENNLETITQILKQDANHGIQKFLPKFYKESVLQSTLLQLKKTKISAFFVKSAGKIITSEKNSPMILFHEIGHAMNFNFSKFGKALHTSRDLSFLSIFIAIIALCTKKESSDEEPKNGINKVTKFIKNNAGKLTFASFLPMLIEEAMATIKGYGFVKKFLNPKLVQNYIKANVLGFSTYLSLALFTSLGTYLGVKLKDHITRDKSSSNK